MFPLVTEPLLLTVTDWLNELDTKFPNANCAAFNAGNPLAVIFAVLIVKVHGSTLVTLPAEKGWPEGKVEVVKVKMHEPKVVTPLAVNPPLVILTFGVAPVPLKATVVVPVTLTGAPAASKPSSICTDPSSGIYRLVGPSRSSLPCSINCIAPAAVMDLVSDAIQPTVSSVIGSAPPTTRLPNAPS